MFISPEIPRWLGAFGPLTLLSVPREGEESSLGPVAAGAPRDQNQYMSEARDLSRFDNPFRMQCLVDTVLRLRSFLDSGILINTNYYSYVELLKKSDVIFINLYFTTTI